MIGDLSEIYDFLRYQGFEGTPERPEPDPQTSPRNVILEVSLSPSPNNSTCFPRI